MTERAESGDMQTSEGGSHPAPDAGVTEGAFVGSAPSVAEAAPPTPVTPEAAKADDRAGIMAAIAEKFGDEAEEKPVETEAKAPEPAAKPAEQTETPEAHDPGEKPAETKADEAKVEDQDDADADPEADALTEEERAAVPKAVQRKVSRLLRNVRRLKPDAEQYRNITRYMAENQLTGEEAARGFEVMALIKRGDPKALEALAPYLEQLNRAAGNVLPDDVKQRVEQGYVDEDSAKEIARLRAEKERLDAERVQQHHNQISDALNGWEARLLAARDPDYIAVQNAVNDYAKASFAAKPPATAEEAVKRVEDFFNSLRGARPKAAPGVVRPVQPVRPGPSSVASPPSQPAREPATLQEAIQNTLRRVGAA